MAQVMKRRSLINSGRRRRGLRLRVRRRRNGPRRMSAKQIKFFGTARQRAALRRRKPNAGRKTWVDQKGKKHKLSRWLRPKKRKKRNYGTRLGRSWSTATAEGRSAGARVGRFRSARKSGKYSKLSRSRWGRTGNSGRRRRRNTKRKNVGAIYSIGLAGLVGGNPGRRGKRSRRGYKARGLRKRSKETMARRRRRTRRSNPSGYRRRRRVYVRRRRRSSNPGSYRRRRYTRHRVSNRRHRRRNPGLGGALSSTTGMLKNAVSVIGGAVASRFATQLALGASNTGAIGYLGNAVAALAIGWAAGKFLKSPQIGAMVTLGGFTGLALRLLSDLTPIGQYVNLSLSGAGKAGDTGIGLISDTTFYVPTVFNSGSMNSAMVPSQIQSLIAAGSVGKPGVGNYRRRRAA